MSAQTRQLAFNAAQKAIEGAQQIRMVTPDCGESRPFTDLQGHYVNGQGLGFWMTIILMPECAGKMVPSLPPFPGPLERWNQWPWR